MAEDDVKEHTLWAESIYGHNTKKGLVKLSVQNAEIICEPLEARLFAFSILEAAEAAETDEWFMSYMGEALGEPEKEVLLMLNEFRCWREQKAQEK
jgi:hypothetical protein